MKGRIWFRAAMGACLYSRAILVILSLVSSALIVIVAFIANIFMDSLQAGKIRVAYLVILLVILCVQQSVSFASREYTIKITFNKRNKIFGMLYTQLMSADISYLNGLHSGEAVARMTSDLDMAVSRYFTLLPTFVSCVVRLTAGIVALIILDYVLALVCLSLGVLLAAMIMPFSKKYKLLYRQSQNAVDKYTSYAQESVRCVSVIKAFGAEDNAAMRMDELLDKGRIIAEKRNRLSNVLICFSELMVSVAMYGVMLLGTLKMMRGGLSVSDFLTALMFMEIIRSPLRRLAAMTGQYMSMNAAIDRLYHMLGHGESVSHTAGDFDKIVIDSVTFGFDGIDILQNINCEINAGDWVDIIGSSAQGKSILLKLLLQFYTPRQGRIYTVSQDGSEDQISRDIFAYVPQDNMMMSGSIADNLRLAMPDANISELYAVCRIACIHNDIIAMPDGYDTVLAEGGGGLSVGQLQRLAIARALLSGRRVLLLDEATSALDRDTECRLLDSLHSLKGYTVISVTHRQTSIRSGDKILNIGDDIK